MWRRSLRGSGAIVFVLLLALELQGAESTPPVEISANDNRIAAGKLERGVLFVRIELREGRWHPEDAKGGFRDVYAFAEEGKAPQAPGPLLRVPQGTEIRASITNRLKMGATIYGLHAHPGDANEGIALAAGETREVKFSARQPGTYLYWASTSGKMLEHRDEAETMLAGALVIEEPGKKMDDRVFVIGYWTTGVDTPNQDGIPWINGKSWPYTERLSYKAGEPVHWRVVNGTFEEHAMHLHGFYFDVEARGDGERYERFAKEQRPKEVTERIEAGHAFEMSWVPERPGNWLFHCHMLRHMILVELLHPKDEKAMEHAEAQDAYLGMGGLVMGVTVTGEEGGARAAAKTEAEHKLQLVIAENPEKIPLYKLAVNDPRIAVKEEKNPPPSLLGPPIILTRGERTEIEVRNQTKDRTSIHWHGIELENYYDGVAGWGTDGKNAAPAVLAGSSFVARMTPPRAGTFIYHTHWHDTKQLENGVYGPLIVLEPGDKYDAEHDRVFLISVGRYAPLGVMMLVNGVPEPDPIFLQAGTRYRFRLINITADEADVRVRLSMGNTVLPWKVLARDGADLAAGQVKSSPADLVLTVGGTADVELQVEGKGNAQLQISSELFQGLIMQPFTFQ